MKSTDFSLKTLEDIFKINWILFLNLMFSSIIIFFYYLFSIKLGYNRNYELKIEIVLILTFFISIIFFLIIHNIVKLNKFKYIIIYFIIFYIFLLSGGMRGQFVDFGGYENLLDIFGFIVFFLVFLISGFVSIPIFFKLYSNVLIGMNKTQMEVENKINYLFLVGFIYVIILNLVYFFSKGIYIMGAIFLFNFILYKYLVKYILAHFKWFLVVNFILLFLPFFVLYMTKMSFFSHQVFLVNNYNDFSLNFGKKIIDILILLSPYQTIIFPLFFNFNAYIIAQKMLEVKYPSTPKDKDIEPRLRPDFKTEQERKDWYDNNF